MLTCKQVSTSLEERDYESLPARQRLGLKMHVLMCVFCRKYNKQRMVMHDIFRRLRQREESGEALTGEHLSQSARSRIQQQLSEQGDATDSD